MATPETTLSVSHPQDRKTRQRQAQRRYRLRNLETRRAQSRAYYHANKERRRVYNKQWNEVHAQERAAYHKNYDKEHQAQRAASNKVRYDAHREERIAKNSAWIHQNPEKNRARVKRRRAAVAGAPRNDLTAAQWREIKAAYGSRCVYCGRKMQRLTMDHITPLSKGGSHTISNIVPACQSCNSKKKDGPVLKPIQPLLL